MIYLDSSVVLAELLAEPRAPSEALRESDLASSRLLIYEVWNRILANRLTQSHGERTRALLTRINFTALSQAALARALEPWPVALRALDSLHLATIVFLMTHGESIELASYDNRMLDAARAMGVPIASL